MTVVPVLSVLLIAYIGSVADYYKLNSKFSSETDDMVIPTYIVPCNVLNYHSFRHVKEVEDYYSVSDPLRIIKVGSNYTSIKEDVKDMFSDLPRGIKYHVRSQGSMPVVNFSQANNIEEMNEEVIRDVKSLMSKNIQFWNSILPDASIWVYNMNETGVHANIQQQNPKNSIMMRTNGYNFMFYRQNKTVRYTGARIPTEGFVSTMNLISNRYLETITESKTPFLFTLALVSPTVDSTIYGSFLDNAYTAICVVLFPISLSLGFPIVLTSMVQDKQRRLSELLKVNGLKEANYYWAYLIFYSGFMFASSMIFYVSGLMLIDLKMFQETNVAYMVQYYAILSVSLTSWAIFVAKLVSQTSTGVFIGYLTSPILMVAVSALSLFVLPIPSKLPFGMLLLP